MQQLAELDIYSFPYRTKLSMDCLFQMWHHITGVFFLFFTHTHSFPHFSLTVSAQTLNFFNANIPSGHRIQFFQMVVHGGTLNSTILSLSWSFLNDYPEMYNLRICIKIIFPPFKVEFFFLNSIHSKPTFVGTFLPGFLLTFKK